jgi:hypothetical protein
VATKLAHERHQRLWQHILGAALGALPPNKTSSCPPTKIKRGRQKVTKTFQEIKTQNQQDQTKKTEKIVPTEPAATSPLTESKTTSEVHHS